LEDVVSEAPNFAINFINPTSQQLVLSDVSRVNILSVWLNAIKCKCYIQFGPTQLDK